MNRTDTGIGGFSRHLEAKKGAGFDVAPAPNTLLLVGPASGAGN